MAYKYDSKDDFLSHGDGHDLKRMSTSFEKPRDKADGENNEDSQESQKAVDYVRALIAEKILIDQEKMPNAARLIDAEIIKVQQMGRTLPKEFKFVDIYREKPVKVAVKVLVPVREHPRFNFMGKLLGPKGNTLKRLQEETMCRITILGRGSKKDPAEEEELRLSLDPKFAHLTDDLHVEISALGPPAEAHARIAFALAELKKFLIPDNNDVVRHEQMREMQFMTGPPRRDEDYPPQRSFPKPNHPMPMRTATNPPFFTRRPPMPSGPNNMKVMSILDRARVSREQNYDYEDAYEPPNYESHSRFPPSMSGSRSNYPAYENESESYKPRPNFSNKYAGASSAPTHWTKSVQSHQASDGRFRTAPYHRP